MITVYKGSISKIIRDNKLEIYKAAGWHTEPEAPQEKAGEEIIRLKPPVKPKATARALEEANINKGDE